MVQNSVLKFAKKGAFELKICMSAILEKGGLFGAENSRKSEKGHLIDPTLLYLVSKEKIM